ncbi:MAG TPA: ankyrin repeat domain-containing protein [Bryobacteraceae bacterium]|jgi:ankyrin repeat protein|nr:ankyrin repeat domain-containing protein [Bryobacteraceae bacterium]
MPDLKTFHEQVKRGDLDGVRAALAEDPSLLNAANEAGQTAFLLAKYYRQEDTAGYLLGLNPKLDVFQACVAGETQAVLSEIDRDPTLLEKRSSDGWTPLHLAAFFGHSELATALLDRGAQVDARSTNGMKNTPLHAAAAGGHADLVDLLAKRGADPNAHQEGGWTALHSAAQAGNREMVSVLVANGAHVNVRAKNSQGPLDMALMKGHAEVAALLEDLGAKLQ